MSTRSAGWFAVGLVGGVAAGLLWWGREQDRHEGALFSPQPMRRLAALGRMRREPTREGLLLLHEYMSWERHPVLRRRARRLLARFEKALA